jgi:hypothetical protein
VSLVREQFRQLLDILQVGGWMTSAAAAAAAAAAARSSLCLANAVTCTQDVLLLLRGW